MTPQRDTNAQQKQGVNLNFISTLADWPIKEKTNLQHNIKEALYIDYSY